MNAMYGDIEELYREVNGSDILAEPDKQKKLNEIQLHLSTLKKKREMAKKMQAHGKIQSIPTTKIEITSLPELKIANLQTASSNKKSLAPSSSSELYLNAVGDLWREPKAKYCYSMDEKSGRHKIFRYLANNKGYKQTADISSALDGKSEQSIRTEIGKMRGNIRKYLKIDGKQVIEERKGSGYRIGSKYKITIKRE